MKSELWLRKSPPPPPSPTAVSGYHNTVMGLSWLTRVGQPERVTKGLRQNLSKSQRSERARHTGATIPPVSSSLVGRGVGGVWRGYGDDIQQSAHCPRPLLNSNRSFFFIYICASIPYFIDTGGGRSEYQVRPRIPGDQRAGGGGGVGGGVLSRRLSPTDPAKG